LLAQLPGHPSELGAEHRIARKPSERATDRTSHRTDEVSEEALRCKLGRCAEWDILPSELAADGAELLAQRGIAGETAERAAEGGGEAAEEISREALRGELGRCASDPEIGLANRKILHRFSSLISYYASFQVVLLFCLGTSVYELWNI
jgi:hypothetical protein